MQLEQRGNGTFSNTWQIEMQEALCHNPVCAPAPLHRLTANLSPPCLLRPNDPSCVLSTTASRRLTQVLCACRLPLLRRRPVRFSRRPHPPSPCPPLAPRPAAL